MPVRRPPIVRRRVKFDFSAPAGKGAWLPVEEWEDILNGLSFVFPAGEAFFIRSVRRYLDRIEEPDLRERAERFIHQEGAHAAEHLRANRALASAYGYGAAAERIARGIMTLCRLAPRPTQLAISCAVEHFTAMFASRLLQRRQEFVDHADPGFAALWLWHAAEEVEHKAVCFDVYNHVVGVGWISYLHRILTMAGATLVLAIVMTWSFATTRRRRSRLNAGRADGSSAKATRKSPSLLVLLRDGGSLSLYCDYYRPTFHPWNDDNEELLEAWREWSAGQPAIRVLD